MIELIAYLNLALSCSETKKDIFSAHTFLDVDKASHKFSTPFLILFSCFELSSDFCKTTSASIPISK